MKKIFRRFIRSQRIYMIPNLKGVICIILFLILSAVAATYSNNLLFLFAFVHVSFLFVAIIQTAKNLRSIEIESVALQSGFAGESSQLLIFGKNKSKHKKYDLQFQFRKFNETLTHTESNTPFSLRFSIELPLRRGQHKLGRIKISSNYPYGLFRGWLYSYPDSIYFVYPKARGTLPLPLLSASSEDNSSTLKEYALGDSLQKISWKHSAKSEKIFIKEFNDLQPSFAELNFESCNQVELEEKLSQLSAWIAQCEKNKIRYRLQLPSYQSSLSLGNHHYHQTLKQLAIYES